MSAESTGYRHVRRAGQQGARPPVLSQAGVEKYATGCGNLSMPSKQLDRLNKTHNLNKKNILKLKMLLIIRNFLLAP